MKNIQNENIQNEKYMSVIIHLSFYITKKVDISNIYL